MSGFLSIFLCALYAALAAGISVHAALAGRRGVAGLAAGCAVFGALLTIGNMLLDLLR